MKEVEKLCIREQGLQYFLTGAKKEKTLRKNKKIKDANFQGIAITTDRNGKSVQQEARTTTTQNRKLKNFQ